MMSAKTIVRRRVALATIVALAAIATLAGCSAPGTGGSQPRSSATSPASSGSTPAEQQSPTATTASGPQACTASPGSATVGDLAIGTPEILYGFNDDFMLPDDLPTDKPLAVTVQGQAQVLGSPLQSRPVVQAAFVISVCNTSKAQTHHLTSFGVQMASLTPYSGQLNALNGCAFLYGRPSGIGGECASGYEPDLELAFQLDGSAAPGAVATQPANTPTDLTPGHSLDVSYSITAPSSPAIATYRLGIGVDAAAVVYPRGIVTHPRISAPIARHWSGTYCSSAQIQSQIPATIPANTYYACPGA